MSGTPASFGFLLAPWIDLRHLGAAWRVVAPVLVLCGWGFAVSASAAPTALQVCKRVENNQDTINHGGTFNFGLNTNLGSFGALNITAYESDGLVCAPVQTVPAGAAQVTVPETVPSGWNNSPGDPARPTWTFTATGLPASGVTGSTQTATLSGTNFSNASGTVQLVFTNRQARTLTVCKRVEDNGQAPANQGGSFSMTFGQTGNSSSSPTLPATYEGQTNCQTNAAYQLNGEAKLADFRETLPQGAVMAPGYPKYELRDSQGSLVGSGTMLNAGSSTEQPRLIDLPLNVGQGNLTLTIVNRYARTRTLRICKAVEDSASFGGGEFLLHYGEGAVGSVGYNTGLSASNIQAGVQNGGVTCGAKAVSESASPLVWESGLPANWTGNAIGYPRWEMYLDDGASDRAGTPLAAGLNEDFGSAVSSATGTFLRLQPGSSDVKVVLVNKMGAYGNGADSTTGALFKLCKEVEDNGNSVSEGARWAVTVNSLGALRLAGSATGALTEGNRQCTGAITEAAVRIISQAALVETFAPSGWPGDAPGYPRVVLRSFTGDSGGFRQGGTVNGGDFGAMAFNSSPIWFLGNPGDATFLQRLRGFTKGDYSINVINRAYPARTLTICTRVDENGLAPVGQVTPMGAEGGTPVCSPPVQMPTGVVTTYQRDYSTFDASSFRNGMLPRYGYLEFNDGPGGTCNGRISAAQMQATTTGQGFVYSANISQRTITPEALTSTDTAAYQAFFTAAGTSACTGNVTATWVMTPAPEVRVCKQALQNGDLINDGGVFALNSHQLPFSSSFGAANPLFTDNLTATEGGSAVCGAVIPLAFGSLGANNTFNSTETLPNGYDNLTPSYPRWEVRAAGMTDPLGHPAGGVIASNQNSLTLTPFLLPDGGTAAGLAQFRAWGNLTFTALNRRGPNRFMRICSESLDNADGIAQTALASYSGALSGQPLGATAPSEISAPEGVSASPSSGLQCTAQIDITALNPQAAAAVITQALGAGFVSDGAFPTWSVYDSNNLTRATAVMTGTGATATIDLGAINTPNFTLVFTNRHRAPLPLLTKALSPTSIVQGATSVLTFTITNIATGAAAHTDIAFTDVLPAHVKVATTPGATHTCTSATVAASSGGDRVVVSAVSLAAGASCTVSVNVTSAVAQTAAERTACSANSSPPAEWTNGNASIINLTTLLNQVTDQCLVVRQPSGTLTVTKNITGVAAGAITQDLTFPFVLACETPTAIYSGTVTVKAGALTGVSGPLTLPAGSSACTLREGNLPAAPVGQRWGEATYTQPVGVPLAADGALTGVINNPLNANTPAAVPVDSPWMLLPLMAALAGLGCRRQRARARQGGKQCGRTAHSG